MTMAHLGLGSCLDQDLRCRERNVHPSAQPNALGEFLDRRAGGDLSQLTEDVRREALVGARPEP